MAIYINNITPMASFPLKVCAGTEKQRFAMACKMTERVYEEMEKGGSVWTVSRYKEVLDKLLAPYKINYEIMQEVSSKYAGAVGRKAHVEKFDNVFEYFSSSVSKYPLTVKNVLEHIFVESCDGFNIKFKYNENGIIQNKYTVFHETRHFFDHLYNPKLSTNRLSVFADYSKEYYKSLDRVYFDIKNLFLLDTEECQNLRKFEKKIRDLLDIFPARIRVNILQDVRYFIKTEVNAYSQDIRKQFRFSLNDLLNGIAELYFYKRMLKYEDKLKIASKLLRQNLETARGKRN